MKSPQVVLVFGIQIIRRFSLSSDKAALTLKTQVSHFASAVGWWRSLLILGLCLTLGWVPSFGQASVGIQKFGAYDGFPDTIDLGSLGIRWEIPLYQKKGRGDGASVTLMLSYNVRWPIDQVYDLNNKQHEFLPGPGLVLGIAQAGSLTNIPTTHRCQSTDQLDTYTDYVWTYVDGRGNRHLFPGKSRGVNASGNICSSLGIVSTGLNAQASDGSGYLIQVGSNGSASITDPSGATFTNLNGSALQDANGNILNMGFYISGTNCANLHPCLDVYGNIIGYGIQDTVNTSIQISGGGYSSDYTSRNPVLITYKDDSGASQTISLNYKMYNWSNSSAPPAAYLENITYPDGSAYHISYQTDSSGNLIAEGSPFNVSGVPGAVVTGLTLPGGGVISYGYPAGTNTATTVNSCTINHIPELTRTTADGTRTYTLTVTSATSFSGSTYSFCAASALNTQVKQPNGDETTVFFVVPQQYAALATGAASGPVLSWFPDDSKTLETKRLEYAAANLNTPIRTTMRCYNGVAGDCTTSGVNEPVTQLAVTTTLDNGLSAQAVTQYTSLGLPTEVDEYDFGGISPARKTLTTYASLGNNISDRPASVTVADGAGNIAKKKIYTYDEVIPSAMTLPNHVTISGSRGNPTSIVDWVNSSGSITTLTKNTYDDAGQVTSTTDPNGNQTAFGYDSATDAYRTSITRPTTGTVAHVSTFSYGTNSGLVTQMHDENSNLTQYGYDSMLRPSSVTYADGGQITYSYTPTSTTTNVLQQTGVWMTSIDQYDGYGRVSHRIGRDGSTTDFTYDSLGRLSTQTNPHRSSSSQTDGNTSYAYDALGRITDVIKADGGVVHTDYSGNVTTITDEAGHSRASKVDAIGRLIEVDEPGDAYAGTMANGSLTINGTLLGINPATPSTGSVTINSSIGEQCDLSVCQTGSVSIAFNNGAETDSASYGSGDTTSTVAANLASAINNCGHPPCYATATASGATVTFTSTAKGVGANWPVATSYNAPAPAAFWATGTVQTANSKTGAPGCLGSTLTAGQNLLLGQCLNSANGRFVLVLQTDGNLVLYDDTPDPNPWIPLWSTGTNGRGVDHGYMQSQGNFVLYAGSTAAIWSSPYSSVNAYFMIMQDDGNLVIYSGFPGPSFTVGPTQQTMSGGKDATPGNSVYDSGTVTVSIGSSFAASAPYGQTSNSTAAQVAAALAGTGPSGLNRPGSPVSATNNGGSITLTYNSVGVAGNVSATVTSNPANSSLFPGGSFSGSTALTGGSDAYPAGLAHPYVTLYAYDTLGNLTCVEQHGDAASGTGCSAAPSSDATSPWRVRRFTYDSLSRLLTANNPESGTISYQYDNNGNVVSKTDARQITSSYSIDALNRVTKKSYSDGTATVIYGYDGLIPAGCTPPALTITNGIDKRTSMCDAAGAESWSFAITSGAGWKTTTSRTTNGVTKTLVYQNNFSNVVTAFTYPSGAILTYTPDVANRLVSAVDSTNSINYVTGATYDATGALAGFVSGNSGSFAGINNSFSYNQRLQPVNMSATSPSATVFSLTYDFHLGNGDNGDVFGISNNKDTTRNQTFTYDALNRLASAQNVGSDCTLSALQDKTKFWGNTYTYDAWGNLLTKGTTKCKSETLSVIALTNNHLSGYGYDASGNMTSDPTDTITSTFDGENRIATTSSNGVTTAYVYDGDGNRIEKTTGSIGTLYWHAQDGIVAESDLAGNIQAEYIFFNGERVARRDGPNGGGGISYYFSDHLNSASVITDSGGNVKAESDYFPWGGEVQLTNNDSNHYKFNGKERDPESGLDDFGFRYDSSLLGRFITPDEPFADQNQADPQSWNLYSYVRNNPETLTDVDGRGTYVCTKNAEGNLRCREVDDDDYKKAREQDAKNGIIAPSLGQSGSITCRGVVCGYVVFQPDNGAVNPEGLGIFEFFLVPGGLRLFGGAGRAAAGEVAVGTAAETAAKTAAEQMALAEAAELAMAEALQATQQAMEAEVGGLIKQAATNASKTAVTQAGSRVAAEQAAKEWVGQGARVIRAGRGSGQVIGEISADGQRVARFTSVSNAKPYINLENKATGGNLHVFF